jgi:hypothetical protein
MTLIDEFLAEYDFDERHSIDVEANAQAVYNAAQYADLSESFIVRMLFKLRGMSNPKLTLRDLEYYKFRILGARPKKELLIGLAGRFWTPSGDLQDVDATNFREFQKDGYAKAAWNFTIDETPKGSLLTTETRIKCIGDSSRRYFGVYWTIIQPFSGWIRMEMLKVIKRRAEAN